MAEAEIALAQEENPLLAPVLKESFLALTPTTYLRGREDRLYPAHCKEILRRVVEGEDLREPTRAEMIGLVAETSLVAVPTRVGCALYFRLFRELFPEREDLFSEVDGVAPSVTRGEMGHYTGDVDDLERDMRRKMKREIAGSVRGRGRP
ncbi:MAG: hypothetical protein GY769_07860 [bacterium]|nr:hypothetical protein [bacterium]